MKFLSVIAVVSAALSHVFASSADSNALPKYRIRSVSIKGKNPHYGGRKMYPAIDDSGHLNAYFPAPGDHNTGGLSDLWYLNGTRLQSPWTKKPYPYKFGLVLNRIEFLGARWEYVGLLAGGGTKGFSINKRGFVVSSKKDTYGFRACNWLRGVELYHDTYEDAESFLTQNCQLIKLRAEPVK